MRLLHPQELKSLYVLPAVRRAFAVALKKKGIDQTRIAKLLGVTPAAVTNYLQSKRASSTKLSAGVVKRVNALADSATSFDDVRAGTHDIILNAWESKNVCGVCNTVNKTKSSCTTCFDNV